MLNITKINTYYGHTHILYDILMKVSPCGVTAVLGRNGMGKTTLLHSIMGFIPTSDGLIQFMDKNITNLKPYNIARLGISLVPQGRRIFSSLSVKENLLFAERKGMESGHWDLEKIYALFPVLKAREKRKGKLLSGGEQQMLSIARALMTNPKLILMDEPSEGLAPLIVQEIKSVIMDCKRDGMSILLVEQNIPFAISVADHIFVIHNGRIAYDSNTAEFKKKSRDSV